jgi:hypothetical protein
MNQRQIDDALNLPRPLRGWTVKDVIFPSRVRKAIKICEWLAEAGGADVLAFQLDRARIPAITFDPISGRYCRQLPARGRPASVMPFPAARHPAEKAA